ncbi:MAG: enoyl-CoA hydratase/isomerase family protein [Saprospiraceae bacterium]|nr:enoyl-CoA hydratase/isomerase family protein [Saprospiraceae bacterium]
MNSSVLLIEQKDGIFFLTINRPDALNALNKEVFDALEQFFKDKKNDFSVKGVIVSGAGNKAFVAGADIKEFIHLDSVEGAALSKRGQDIFFMIENFHAPVVAAVNGFALGGGCELSMACHLIIAGEHARFGQPEVNLGLVPGYGGSQRLVQNIGKTRALKLLLTGDMITATQALEWGLVNEVVPSGEEKVSAEVLLQKIVTKGPLAIQKTISLVNDFFNKAVDGFKSEYEDFGYTLGSDDAKEGAAAFIEKRKPSFKGK